MAENPWELVLDQSIHINLDEPRWLETYADQLAAAKEWRLEHKEQNVILVEKARPGMRYLCRNFRRSNRGGILRAYGFVWDGGGSFVLPQSNHVGGWRWTDLEHLDEIAVTLLDRV